MTYAVSRLQEEIAYLAYHLHWRLEDIMNLEHHDRRGFITETASLVSRSESGR